MRIGVDIDGVLADLNRAYIRLIEQETGIILPPVSDSYPDCWHYAEKFVPEPELNRVWEFIKDPANHFWAKLAPLPGAPAAVGVLARSPHDVYYITNRPGKTAKMQTEIWLKGLGMAMPTVLLSNQKGPVAVGLALDIFIDDRLDNCFDVLMATRQWHSKQATKVYVVDAPYNRVNHYNAVERVKSVSDALRHAGVFGPVISKVAA